MTSSEPKSKCLQPSPGSLKKVIKMSTYNFLTKDPARLRWQFRKLEISVLFHQQNIRHFILGVAEQRNSKKHFHNHSEGKLTTHFH